MQNSEKTYPRSISKYLYKKDSPLSDLYKKALTIQEIDHNLKNILNPTLSSHFILANIKAEIAVIFVKSPAWATRLRYNIPTILDALNNQLNLKTIKTIRIKVQHPQSAKLSKNNSPVSLSKNTVQLLQETAKGIDDLELKNSLINLSKNYK